MPDVVVEAPIMRGKVVAVWPVPQLAVAVIRLLVVKAGRWCELPASHLQGAYPGLCIEPWSLPPPFPVAIPSASLAPALCMTALRTVSCGVRLLLRVFTHNPLKMFPGASKAG